MGKEYATVSSKGQLVIPASLREKYGIETGTKVAFIEHGSQLVLEFENLASKIRRVKEMRGALAGGPWGTDLLLEERRAERERELRDEGW